MPIALTKPKTDFWEYRQLWVGPPKIGKTKTAAQIKDGLFVFTESGFSDLSIAHWVPSGWDVNQKGAFIITDPLDYQKMEVELGCMPQSERPKTLIFDTVDGMINTKALELIHDPANKAETLNEGALSFGKGWDRVRIWLHDFVADIQRLNIGVIFISHFEEKTITEIGKEPKTVWRSSMPDRAKPIIQGLVDFIWFFKQEGKSRWIYTQGDLTIEAGTRITMPERISMGHSPQEAYSNILTAFYGVNGNKDKAKSELLDRILRGEAYLAEKKIDGFGVEKRKVASREKHLGFADPELATIENMEAYLQHLRNKAEEAKNGNPQN